MTINVTKERLEQIVHAAGLEICDYEEVFDGIKTGEIVQMARMLLVGMEQEPVAYLNATDVSSSYHHILAKRSRSHACTMPVYAEPLSQVIDDSDIATKHIAWLEENFPRKTFSDEEWEEVRLYTWLAWRDACRADMLQTVNSPAIPDGWIKCSERMPDVDLNYSAEFLCSNGYAVFTAACRCELMQDGSTHKYFNYSWADVEYWMPLPEPPKP